MEKGQEAISGPAQGDQVSIKCCMGSVSGGLGVEASIGSGHGIWIPAYLGMYQAQDHDQGQEQVPR